MTTYESIADRLAADDRFDEKSRCRLARRMFDTDLSDRVCEPDK